MPKPQYIIVAASGAEDRLTGLVSLYSVMEKIVFGQVSVNQEGKKQLPSGGTLSAVLAFRVVAAWSRSSEDSHEDAFEFQMVLKTPDGEEVKPMEGTFAFSPGKDLHRFTLIGEIPPFTVPGLFVAESRVRRKGESEWLSQSYSVVVEKANPEEPPATANPPDPARV